MSPGGFRGAHGRAALQGNALGDPLCQLCASEIRRVAAATHGGMGRSCCWFFGLFCWVTGVAGGAKQKWEGVLHSGKKLARGPLFREICTSDEHYAKATLFVFER